MSYLFVFGASPDIDHMTPLAWKLLEEGEEVHVVIARGYDPRADHRIELLRQYPAFSLHEAWPAPRRTGRLEAGLSQLRGYLRCTLPFALGLVKREGVRLVAVEWGYGLRPEYVRLRSVGGVLVVLRSLVGSFLRARAYHQVRTNFVVAARLLGLPNVALPHGLNVKNGIELNGRRVETLERDLLDSSGCNPRHLTVWLTGPAVEPDLFDCSDCNRFSAYVLNTEQVRDWYVNHARGDSRVMKNMGSLRWAPEWFEKNLRLAPHFEWPADAGDRVKAVFMVPKWPNLVHTDDTLQLVKRLQELDYVSLAVMGHPRKEGRAEPLYTDPDIDWSRIHLVSGANSVSVIRACDVVIDVGSSIGIEAVMQGKVLVNPRYIHDPRTLFDTVEDCCVVADSADEVVGYLRAHADGLPHVTSEAAYNELLRRTVYGSRPEPFDVLDEHYRLVSELASNGGHKGDILPSTEGRNVHVREQDEAGRVMR